MRVSLTMINDRAALTKSLHSFMHMDTQRSQVQKEENWQKSLNKYPKKLVFYKEIRNYFLFKNEDK